MVPLHSSVPRGASAWHASPDGQVACTVAELPTFMGFGLSATTSAIVVVVVEVLELELELVDVLDELVEVLVEEVVDRDVVVVMEGPLAAYVVLNVNTCCVIG